MVVLGIAEFGRAYYAQTTLSQAAREAVRVMALDNSRSSAVTAARNAAQPLDVSSTQVQVLVGTSTSASCPTGGTTTATNATVQITYSHTYITGLFGSAVTLRGKGVMRCASD